MNVVLMSLLGYLLGSIPFSLVLGRLFLKDDIRRYGADRNPGAANAWKAGKWKLGVPALLLDFAKGAAPVAYAQFGLGITGWRLLPIALAPILGHAFPVFLRFQGGKALAVSFGSWAGVTLGEGPIVLGLLMVVFLFTLSENAWAVIVSMLLFLIYWLWRSAPAPILALWLGNFLILAWKHRRDLRRGLHLKPPPFRLAH